MCRLVGWVSREPRSLAEVLGASGLEELLALSQRHADGWGVASYDGAELLRHASHLPAHASPDFATAARELRSDAALVHLRWATPGLAVAPENTHPFVVDGWAMGHNGAVRPAAGLLDLLEPGALARLRGTTDSERLLHVLLARVAEHGLDEGLARTVTDVCRDLTPTSLNALLLGHGALTALCSHGRPGGTGLVEGPPEDQPGYFDLRWRRTDDLVVVASEPLGDGPWERLSDGHALTVSRGDLAVRLVDVGPFPSRDRA